MVKNSKNKEKEDQAEVEKFQDIVLNFYNNKINNKLKLNHLSNLNNSHLPSIKTERILNKNLEKSHHFNLLSKILSRNHHKLKEKDIETEDNKIEKMKEKPNIDLRKINNINTVNKYTIEKQDKEKQILIKENPEKDRFISKFDKKQVKEDNKVLIQRFQTESNKMKEIVKQEESKLTKYEKDETYDKIDMNKK